MYYKRKIWTVDTVHNKASFNSAGESFPSSLLLTEPQKPQPTNQQQKKCSHFSTDYHKNSGHDYVRPQRCQQESWHIDSVQIRSSDEENYLKSTTVLSLNIAWKHQPLETAESDTYVLWLLLSSMHYINPSITFKTHTHKPNQTKIHNTLNKTTLIWEL